MRKKTFIKAIAIIACFCILSLSVPNVIAAEKNVKRFPFKVLVKKSAIMFFSLFPFLSPIFDTGKSSTPSHQLSNSDGIVKVTGMLRSVRQPNCGAGE